MGSFTDVSPPERQQEQTFALMASGVVGQARIDQVTDTGATVNDNPQVDLDLTVMVPDHDPYPATLTQVISRLAIGDFHPGATVEVRVNPDDPQALMIA
jgi:hypothetical protein